MQARIDLLGGTIGWDPLDGLGRTRLGVARLRWRLERAPALAARPLAPQDGAAPVSG
jgi:methyl acetate hydrolase